MRKRLSALLLIGAVATLTVAAAGFSYSLYERGIIVPDPTNPSSAIDIETDQNKYVDCSLQVIYATTDGWHLYVYGSFNNWVTSTAKKMTYNNSTSKWEATFSVKKSTNYEYKYFLARTADPDTDRTIEGGSNRTLNVGTSTINQDDGYCHRDVQLRVNYNMNNNGYIGAYFRQLDPHNHDLSYDQNTNNNDWYLNITLNCNYDYDYRFWGSRDSIHEGDEKHYRRINLTLDSNDRKTITSTWGQGLDYYFND